MKKELSYQLEEVKNGLLMIAYVRIIANKSDQTEHELIESYSGEGWQKQGCAESIPYIGYVEWKLAIINGLKYGLSKLKSNQKLKIEIIEAKGLLTDTTSEMLSYASSRCIINEFPNSETLIELSSLKDRMYKSPKNFKQK